MKIYHKRNFALGLFLGAMGILLLAVSLPEIMALQKRKTVILIGLCLLLGSGLIARSLSPKLSREDRVEELDERNQLVRLKTGNRAFQVTQLICLALMSLLLILGKSEGEEPVVYAGLGFAGAFSVSVLAELFAGLYYEKRG